MNTSATPETTPETPPIMAQIDVGAVIKLPALFGFRVTLEIEKAIDTGREGDPLYIMKDQNEKGVVPTVYGSSRKGIEYYARKNQVEVIEI